MSKTTRSALAEHVQTELVAYLKAGQPINQDQVARALDTTGLAIQDFDRLLNIRFALSEPVQAYLGQLHERLRRIRTESAVKREETRGEIRGSIDWGQTIRKRYAENPSDRSRFTIQTPETEYQLPENLLVKTLLATIATTARSELLEIDYQWRRDRWDDGEIRQFLRQFEQNVHLDRIEADADTRVTPQALDKARQSRQPLYYEAYDLYRLLEQLRQRDFDNDAASRLLFDTLVLPDTATLFELAVIFELLDHLQAALDISLQSIEGGSDPIATMTDNTWEYRVYHDSTGRLRFNETVPESTGIPYLERSETALQRHKHVMGQATQRALYSGVPDIIIEVYPQKEAKASPRHIVIGEVKHTDRKSTFSTGVYELMRYLEFARPDGRKSVTWGSEAYLSEQEDISVHGLIITDGLTFQPNLDELPVTHLNFNEISASNLTTSLTRSS